MQNKRDKKRKGPVEESKPDTTKNIGNLDEIIASQREREKNLYPVREEYKRDKLMRLKQ